MKLRDKYGYPVEFINGKRITNFIRALSVTNIRQTIRKRNHITVINKYSMDESGSANCETFVIK